MAGNIAGNVSTLTVSAADGQQHCGARPASLLPSLARALERVVAIGLDLAVRGH